MTNCGALGWVSDERGYRYQAEHPQPGCRGRRYGGLLEAWRELAGYGEPPQACLVNFYDQGGASRAAPGSRRTGF